MRSQEEILERFNKVNDVFGTQKSDLIDYMEFKTAKEFLKDEYVKQVESGEKEWEQTMNPKKEILGYLDFAYGKAHNERGLSAGRSMLHFKTWIWIDDEKFYNEIVDEMDSYNDYGLAVLDKISKHYGFVYAE